jgi:DNA polymerase-3 subunit alpha
MLDNVDKIMDSTGYSRRDIQCGQKTIADFFGLKNDMKINDEEFNKEELLSREKEVLGFYISGHPLEIYSEDYLSFADTTSTNCQDKDDEAVVNTMGIVVSIKNIRDRRGKPMAFFEISDYGGTISCMAFSECYERDQSKLKIGKVIGVNGEINKKKGIKIIANTIYACEAGRLVKDAAKIR